MWGAESGTLPPIGERQFQFSGSDQNIWLSETLRKSTDHKVLNLASTESGTQSEETIQHSAQSESLGEQDVDHLNIG